MAQLSFSRKEMRMSWQLVAVIVVKGVLLFAAIVIIPKLVEWAKDVIEGALA